MKPRTHLLSGSGSFPCSCETPHFCGQMPWQLEHRASCYKLRALVPTPNIRLCKLWPGGLFAWLLCQASLLPPVRAGSYPSTGWQAPLQKPLYQPTGDKGSLMTSYLLSTGRSAAHTQAMRLKFSGIPRGHKTFLEQKLQA